MKPYNVASLRALYRSANHVPSSRSETFASANAPCLVLLLLTLEVEIAGRLVTLTLTILIYSPMVMQETDVEDHGDACPSIERRSMGDAHRPRDRNGSNLRGHGSASKKHWSSVGQEFGVGNCPTCAERNECRSCRNGQPVMARLGGALSSEQEGDWTEAQNIRSKASSTAMDEVGDARVDVVGREARQVTGAPGQACDVADVLDAQVR